MPIYKMDVHTHSIASGHSYSTIKEMAAFAAEAAKEMLGEENVITSVPAPNMGGEDFAYYLEKYPGAFMFLSTANAEIGADTAHHNPKFMIDEEFMWKGPAVFAGIAMNFLK